MPIINNGPNGKKLSREEAIEILKNNDTFSCNKCGHQLLACFTASSNLNEFMPSNEEIIDRLNGKYGEYAICYASYGSPYLKREVLPTRLTIYFGPKKPTLKERLLHFAYRPIERNPLEIAFNPHDKLQSTIEDYFNSLPKENFLSLEDRNKCIEMGCFWEVKWYSYDDSFHSVVACHLEDALEHISEFESQVLDRIIAESRKQRECENNKEEEET